MASGSMKGFFRQRKNSGGISKPKSKASTVSSSRATSPTPNPKSSPSPNASLASDLTQPKAFPQSLASLLHGKSDEGGEEEVLRQFDLNMLYGPCLGMSRLARWERACRLGMNPPQDIRTLLEKPEVRSQCLWDGCV